MANLEMKLIVRGVVQGVGYRYFIVSSIEIENIKVSGHIQNLADGSVEIVAVGDIENLKKLRKIAGMGPNKSTVREIEEFELKVATGKNAKGFTIIS